MVILKMMKGVSLVLLLTCISICSGSTIRGDEDETILVIDNMFEKLENFSSQLQEHDGMMQNMTEGMKDRLTQLELGLESTREVLPSEPLQDVINSALKNGLQEILQDEDFRLCGAPPTAAISSPRTYKKEIPSESGKFYCSLDVDRKFAKGSCYFLSSETDKWSNARDKCLQMGADLVKIETEEEFTFLKKLTVGDTWIGLTDQKVEGQYMWVVDGSFHVPSHFDYMWTPGEPNNYPGGSEHCIHFKQRYCLLNDVRCSHVYRFICELPYQEVLL